MWERAGYGKVIKGVLISYLVKSHSPSYCCVGESEVRKNYSDGVVIPYLVKHTLLRIVCTVLLEYTRTIGTL